MEEGRYRPSVAGIRWRSTFTPQAAMEEGRYRPSVLDEVTLLDSQFVPQWRRADIGPRWAESKSAVEYRVEPQWRRADIGPR